MQDYFAAAQIEEIPDDLGTPRHQRMDPSLREAACARVETATEIWCAADDDAGRREQMQAADPSADVVQVLSRHLDGSCARLPPAEMEYALGELGLLDENNGVLSKEEKDQLDQEGWLDLGPLIAEPQLEQMRERYDAAIAAEGAKSGHEVSQMPGIGRVSGTVLKPMNRDGLLDVVSFHPRLLAAARRVLGVHFKYSSSNYHCPMPGYGHQGIHCDWGWGVRSPEVVNAIWMLDDFTEENGPTRIVPGSHLWRLHPHGDRVDGQPRDLNAPVDGQIHVTGKAGSCMVYNAHLWHSGTQNKSHALRRAQHAFFTRAIRAPQSDVPSLLDKAVFDRLGRVERAILDVG